MNAVVTLRVKIKNLSEDTLLVLKNMVQEADETYDVEVTDREAIIYAAIEWLADGTSVGGETYMEMYTDHGVHIYNRSDLDGEPSGRDQKIQ